MPSPVVDALLPPQANPAHPRRGFWEGAADALGLTDAMKALRGQMTETEAKDFLFGAALGVLPAGRGAKAIKKAKRLWAPSDDATPMLYGNPALRGSMNPLDDMPLTFKGKPPSEWTPGEFADVGDIAGVKNLGPLTEPKTFKTTGGTEVTIPGGTEGNFTYYDMLYNKANPIDPSQLDPGLHRDLQAKLSRSLTPDEVTPERSWSGLTFGMTSPNNPLFPNQLAASRLRAREPSVIQALAGMSPFNLGQKASQAERLPVSAEIARQFGLNAGPEGGLGVRGSADYTRVSDLAKMFERNPEFFKRGPAEDWKQYTERISSQVPGLSMKTGSFGVVWEDPAKAATSAIDRHMAMNALREGTLFTDTAEKAAWESRLINLWNEKNPSAQVANLQELSRQPGGEGAMIDSLLGFVNDARNPKLRTRGFINPALPEHLRNVSWVNEPETAQVMGPHYTRALDATAREAEREGLGVFARQHMVWDRIRRRYEPHENMFPGLERMPAMSKEQLRGVTAEHRASGHMNYSKTDKEGRPLRNLPEGEEPIEAYLQPTRKRPNPAPFGYFALPVAGAPLLWGREQR